MKYERYFRLKVNDLKPSNEESIVGLEYVCIEEFQTTDPYGKPGHVNVGDVFTVVREPIPEKKKYKLIRDTKFGEENLYLRKSELKRYFDPLTKS